MSVRTTGPTGLACHVVNDIPPEDTGWKHRRICTTHDIVVAYGHDEESMMKWYGDRVTCPHDEWAARANPTTAKAIAAIQAWIDLYEGSETANHTAGPLDISYEGAEVYLADLKAVLSWARSTIEGHHVEANGRVPCTNCGKAIVESNRVQGAGWIHRETDLVGCEMEPEEGQVACPEEIGEP